MNAKAASQTAEPDAEPKAEPEADAQPAAAPPVAKPDGQQPAGKAASRAVAAAAQQAAAAAAALPVVPSRQAEACNANYLAAQQRACQQSEKESAASLASSGREWQEQKPKRKGKAAAAKLPAEETAVGGTGPELPAPLPAQQQQQQQQQPPLQPPAGPQPVPAEPVPPLLPGVATMQQPAKRAPARRKAAQQEAQQQAAAAAPRQVEEPQQQQPRKAAQKAQAADAFHVPASSANKCLHCKGDTRNLGHRSWAKCPDFRSLHKNERVSACWRCSCMPAHALRGRKPALAACGRWHSTLCRMHWPASTNQQSSTRAATPAAPMPTGGLLRANEAYHSLPLSTWLPSLS